MQIIQHGSGLERGHDYGVDELSRMAGWLWCQIYFPGKIVRLPLICLVCEESWAGSIKLGSRSFGK